MSLPIRTPHPRRTTLILIALAVFAAPGCRHTAQSLDNLPQKPLASLMPPPEAWRDPKAPASMRATLDPPAPTTPARPGALTPLPDRLGHMAHRVRPGDTLFALARQYYNDAAAWRMILDANRHDIPDPSRLQAGILLYLPTAPLRQPDGRMRPPHARPDYYIVAPGDTLARIAETFLGNPNAYPNLAQQNNLQNPNQLQPGMILTLPTP